MSEDDNDVRNQSMQNPTYKTLARASALYDAVGKVKTDKELDTKYEKDARRHELQLLTESFVVASAERGHCIIKTDIQRGLSLATYTLALIDKQVEEEFDIDED